MLQKWNRKDAFFKTEILSDGKNHWPRDPDPGEIAYKRWLDKVRDPTTQVFYKGHDEKPKFDDNGNAIPGETVTVEIEPDYTVTTILRIKTFAGQEFLTSIGQCIGYSQMGDEEVRSYSEPEKWEEVTFGHRMTQDAQGRWKRTTEGPKSIITHYELPFTKDAALALWEKRDPRIGCQLNVMIQASEDKQTVPSIDLFTSKPFDYLMNRDYMSPEEKRAEREKWEREHPDLVPTTSKGKK